MVIETADISRSKEKKHSRAPAARVLPAPNTPLIGQSVLPSSDDNSSAAGVARKWPSQLWTSGRSASLICFSSSIISNIHKLISQHKTHEPQIVFLGPVAKPFIRLDSTSKASLPAFAKDFELFHASNLP